MMKFVVLFGILICASACTKEYVVVQRCHELPEPAWKTVKELYQDDLFVREYLKECVKAE